MLKLNLTHFIKESYIEPTTDFNESSKINLKFGVLPRNDCFQVDRFNGFFGEKEHDFWITPGRGWKL